MTAWRRRSALLACRALGRGAAAPRPHACLTRHAPAADDVFFAQAFLTPTVIYVKKVVELNDAVGLKGVVHITGGGMTENIPRVIPKGLGVQIHTGSYEVPPLFQWLQKAGNVPTDDMRRTFNMGVGMVVVVDAANVDAVISRVPGAWAVGEVVKGDGVSYA